MDPAIDIVDRHRPFTGVPFLARRWGGEEAHAMADEFLKLVQDLPWVPKSNNVDHWRRYWTRVRTL